jgi:hypothetical protein
LTAIRTKAGPNRQGPCDQGRFRFRADLEDLDLTFYKDLTKARIKELSELSFLSM